MQLTELLPEEEWIAFERSLNQKTGLNGCVYDADGFRITNYINWANPICPLVKSKPQSLQAICSIAHQNLAAQARKERRAVIGECDAGFVKICAPVFKDGAFVGAMGGCGLLLEDGEVETFLLGRLTGRDEDELDALAAGVDRLSMERAEEVARYIESKVSEMIG